MKNLHEVWFLRNIQCQLLEICIQLLDGEFNSNEEVAEQIAAVINLFDEIHIGLTPIKSEVK